MAQRADVSDIAAVEEFRARLVRFCEAANAAVTAADADVARTLTWLESEQIPYWQTAVRKAGEGVTAAKAAWREKALFKDATGAKSSAVDEKAALDRATRWLEEAQERHKAARQELLKLRREQSAYKGPVGRLANVIGGPLVEAQQELRRVVEQLEKYGQAKPEAGVAAQRAQEHAAVSNEVVEPPDDPIAAAKSASELLELIAGLTPAARVRSAATRRAAVPALPLIPPEARDALSLHLTETRFGKYDLMTTMLPAGATRIYLERREPTNATDTGWHVGTARADDGSRSADAPGCGIVTYGKLADAAPEWAELLRLPVGTLLLAEAGELVAAVDPLGRALWWAS